MNKIWPYTAAGIPDELFIRGRVPMTKREVRALTISHLCLQPNLTVWDIGAGTGSITVEAAHLIGGGQVYAVERNTEGLSLIEQNVKHFDLHNVSIVPGIAPDALHTLPEPQRIIVGGSGGRLQEILELCGERLAEGGRIVINALSPKNMLMALDVLQKAPFTDAEGIYVQIARMEKLGREDVFRAQNGIWIISAAKEA